MSQPQNPNMNAQIELQTSNPCPTPLDTLRQDPIDSNIKRTSGSTNSNDKTTCPPHLPPKKPSFISLLHFFYVFKVVRFINSLKDRPPNEDDLKPLIYCQTCEPLENLFTQYYYELRVKYEGQIKLLPVILYKIFKKNFYLQIAWDVLYIIARILEPYFLYLTLKSLRNPAEPLGNAYAAAVGVFICFLVATYAFHQFNYNANWAANGMKIGIMGMLFRKMNKISLFSLQKFSFGKFLNIVSTDLNNIDNMQYALFILLLPLSYGGSIVLLCYWWGPSGLVSIGYMMIINILQFIITLKILGPGKVRSQVLDERIRIMTEILEGIRVIKMQAWDSFMINKICEIRKFETKKLTHVFYFFSVTRALSYSSQYVSAFLLLLTYSEVDGNFSAAKIFPTILLLGFLKQFAMVFCMFGWTYVILAISLSMRVNSIMDLPEIPSHKEHLEPISPENIIEFKNFSGYWTKKDLGQPAFQKPPPSKLPKNLAPPEASASTTPAISNINLEIKTGELVAVVGLTGSGKSSLLLSFSREMIKTEGELRYKGSIVYVSQESLALALSIRDGITLGTPYDDELFWKVVDACCLRDFIESLPKKEFNEMAERGMNLSGAQRAQIALARALYANADIYLIDDPFSSFDQHLGKLIFKKAIQEFLKDKTVVLVTHNLDFVKHANIIVILKAGSIIGQGTYGELAHKDIGIKLTNELKRRAKYENKDIHSFGQGRQYDEVHNPEKTEVKEKIASDTAIDLTGDDNGLFIEDERLDDGKVTFKIYWAYFRTIFHWWNIIPFIILFGAPEAAGWQFMIRVSDWLLGEYSDSEAYGILAAIAFGSMIIYLIKFLLYYTCGVDGARKLHDKMLKGMFYSPFKFFITNRIGRILNRFSNDITQLDRFILNTFLDLLEGFCFFIIYLVALWVHELWILIPAGIALVAFIITFLYFKKSINQARGLELTVRGPMYSFFSSLMEGLTVSRVRDRTENIMKAFYKRADDYSRANVAYRSTLRLMTFVLDYITQLTVIGTFCYYIGQKGNPIVNGPFINMLISLPTTMQFILRSFMNFHALMASVARIINYSNNKNLLQMVKPHDEQLKRSGWPHGGEIDIKNASMRYGEKKPLFLKDLNVNVQPGEKVAVIGESSFGMTSMINMITRVLHIESKPDAHVNIDSVNIEDIGLTLIRNSMVNITQIHYLFTGTIRENLDPEKKYTDEEVWEALDVVGLKGYIEGLEAKLGTYYVRGCSLLSVGQKQLLNVARSILKKDTSIVIQDRSTYHVDVLTEHQVQKNMRKRYANATTLMTTYRLWNIGGFDRVLCMKGGVKIEFDEPYRLLVKEIGDKEVTNKEGYFAKLILDMNPKVAKQAFQLAMIAYYKRHNLNLDEKQLLIEPELLEGPCGEVEDFIMREGERQGEEGENLPKLAYQESVFEEMERKCLY